MTSILIEGYTPEELLSFTDEQLEPFIQFGTPIVFRIGSASILGEFKLVPGCLVVELAQIDGGGEGVLPTLWVLVHRYAMQHQIMQIDWIVHAINCAKPNLKLRRLLKRRGFTIDVIPNIGEAYHYISNVTVPTW